MFQRHICALRQLIQACSFYSVRGTLLRKSFVPIRGLSTDAGDCRVLKEISKMTQSELKDVNATDCIDRIDVLKSRYFLDSECLKMITEHPEILRIPLKQFENTINQWISSNLKMDAVRTVLLRNPMLLEIECKEIRKRLPHLLAICGSSEMLKTLLINSPCVMTDDWNVILEKVNYLLKVRGFSIGPVVDSFGLSRPMDFIKFRFDLLEKCGIYKQKTCHAHKINKYDKSQFKNPSLKDILQLNDKKFSYTIAKISLEEYEFCYDLFMAEPSEADTDLDNDTDSDDNDH